MRNMVVLGLVVCASLLMVACTNEKKEEAVEPQKNSTVKPIQQKEKDLSVVDTNEDQLVEEFMTVYINQSFNKELLNQKEKRLLELAGDSSLDLALSDLAGLKAELAAYEKSKTLATSASVTLVERELDDLQVYKDGAMYFVDVEYTESSPAYEGKFERRQQYTFKVEEGKIVQFEEVLNR